MSQMKVSEIAARINKSTNDTLKLLIIEKVNVRSESSLVDNAVAEKLIEKFKSSNTGVKSTPNGCHLTMDVTDK